MKECFIDKSFREDSWNLIRQAESICTEYARQGYDLTLRQLYYQFVARGIIPNKDTEYKRLGSIVNDARLAGMIDWNHINDRTRNLAQLLHFDDPSDRIDHAAKAYRIDLWEGQEYRVEVWVEKEALAGVVQRAAQPKDVPYFSCRGYVSQSEMWAAGKRLRGYILDGQKPVVIHLGDHDPSGIDMSRDIKERLWMFVADPQDFKSVQEGVEEEFGKGQNIADAEQSDLEELWGRWAITDAIMPTVEVNRIALNMAQVRQFNPPPNPAKTDDARFQGYNRRFGNQSWELDALDPNTLNGLITAAIDEYLDADMYNARHEQQENERKRLTACAKRWNDVDAFLATP